MCVCEKDKEAHTNTRASTHIRAPNSVLQWCWCATGDRFVRGRVMDHGYYTCNVLGLRARKRERAKDRKREREKVTREIQYKDYTSNAQLDYFV